MTNLDPARTARSLALTVEPLTDSRYRVVGGAGEHIVQHEDGGWQCSCPDSRFNGGVCSDSRPTSTHASIAAL